MLALLWLLWLHRISVDLQFHLWQFSGSLVADGKSLTLSFGRRVLSAWRLPTATWESKQFLPNDRNISGSESPKLPEELSSYRIPAMAYDACGAVVQEGSPMDLNTILSSCSNFQEISNANLDMKTRLLHKSLEAIGGVCCGLT